MKQEGLSIIALVALISVIAANTSASYASSFNTASARGNVVDNRADDFGGCYIQLQTNTDPFWVHMSADLGDCTSLSNSTCIQVSGEVAQTFVSGSMIGPVFIPPPIDQFQMEAASWSVSSECGP